MKMMRKMMVMLFALLVVACSGEAEVAVEGNVVEASTTTDRVRLSADYPNALPIQSQLAIGTIQLEESDLAVDETLATEILPLWRALQSLSASETTASAEITAVLNQIQDTMTPEQITAITDLQLTDEMVQTMIADGTLAFGRGPGGQGGGAEGGQGGGRGGGPGGGLLGGGGGGRPGGDVGNADPDELATRRAERFGESGAGDFLSNAMTGAVVNLLARKTGEEAPQRENIQAIIIEVIAPALDMSVEELTTQVEEGALYADLLAAAGVDTTILRSELETALSDTQLAQRGDLDNTIDQILGEGE